MSVPVGGHPLAGPCQSVTCGVIEGMIE